MMKPQNFAEFVIWYYITGTLVLYFLGAQFLAVPGVAWLLFLYLLKKLWQQTDETPLEDRITISTGSWVWIGSMLVIGFALIIGHFDFGYDSVKIVKSFINFFLRTWALLALFPLAGCLKIRPQLIYRAVCILCLQCFVLVIICYLAHFAGLELPKYTSTLLAKIGGNDPHYYTVNLSISEQGEFRILLFAPWAPALAFAGNIFFCLASQDSSKTWRWIGMISSAAMIWGSVSRLGLLCLIMLPFLRLIVSSLSRPIFQFSAAVGSFISGLYGYQLIGWMRDFQGSFVSQRQSSTQVRATLAQMSLYSWQTEAPIWGHGVTATEGPEVVQFMPLGSHHTWLGLLYVHGLVGAIALMVPLIFTFVELLLKAQRSKVAQTGLAILFVLLLFSMGENLETLAYIYWPGLVMLGIALSERGTFEELNKHSIE